MSTGKGRKYGAGAYNTPKKVRFFGNEDQNAAKKEKNKAKYTASSNNSNKIWMAVFAGASAGVIAGLLMAPESGKSTLNNLKRSALKIGDDMDEKFRMLTNKMESMGLTRSGDSLRIQGNWDQVKGKMKSQYGDLTDQDLAYIEGKEDTFLGGLEAKLGKTKQELVSWINSLA
jgi:uncharacterized protein YjbJ (UPF0337 family)